MYKDCLCSLKYNQPVQTWHACLISCYVSIFSKQTSSKRCIQVMLSSCTQSVSMTTVYLLFLAFYPQVTSLPGHNKASSLFPFVSERLLFRSQSRKLQVRKQWGIQSRFLQAELSLVWVFFSLTFVQCTHNKYAYLYYWRAHLWIFLAQVNNAQLTVFEIFLKLSQLQPHKTTGKIRLNQYLPGFILHKTPTAWLYLPTSSPYTAIYNTSVWRIQKSSQVASCKPLFLFFTNLLSIFFWRSKDEMIFLT